MYMKVLFANFVLFRGQDHLGTQVARGRGAGRAKEAVWRGEIYSVPMTPDRRAQPLLTSPKTVVASLSEKCHSDS